MPSGEFCSGERPPPRDVKARPLQESPDIWRDGAVAIGQVALDIPHKSPTCAILRAGINRVSSRELPLPGVSKGLWQYPLFGVIHNGVIP